MTPIFFTNRQIQSSEFSLRGPLNNSEELLGLAIRSFSNKDPSFMTTTFSILNLETMKFQELNLTGACTTNFAYFNICTVSPMGFVVDINHTETKKFLKKHDHTSHKIAHMLKNWQIVDEIISQLTKE